ncbi:hypothetical protein ACH42_07575 [Endozoicomonas sp. (ex Bugula neritina AB1)]|nr:hypothetical protein ACH42_07575 [Endozoicomonas sp. (ex Bugula neritina AB1)]
MDGKLSDLRVLIIEDHDFQRIVAEQIVSGLGVKKLFVAANGQQALDILDSSGAMDIVICDLKMPGMDGIQFIRKMAERHLSHSLIILSALDSALTRTVEDMAQTLGLQVLGSLPKPLSRDRIRELMELYFGEKPDQGRAIVSKELQFDFDTLQHAIENDEFTLYFQPKVLLKGGRLVSVEALARWQHPTAGLVSPARFIPLMESNKLITALTLNLLDHALDQICHWQEQGRMISVGINISPVMLTEPNLPDLLIERIQVRQIPPELLTLEITESSLIENTAMALETLARLKMQGFSLSIDDFGTGYSSMQQLNRIPFSELKIDRSFVHNASNDSTQRAIIEANINLALNLKMETVAEGIETLEDWTLLNQLNCTMAQGYFVGKPMPAIELPDWEQQWLARQPIISSGR